MPLNKCGILIISKKLNTARTGPVKHAKNEVQQNNESHYDKNDCRTLHADKAGESFSWLKTNMWWMLATHRFDNRDAICLIIEQNIAYTPWFDVKAGICHMCANTENRSKFGRDAWPMTRVALCMSFCEALPLRLWISTL